jgi:hypothetical protein
MRKAGYRGKKSNRGATIEQAKSKILSDKAERLKEKGIYLP